MRDDSAEILFQSFLQETHVSSSGMGRYVHPLLLSIQHFLCRSRRCPPSKVPRRMAFERLSWRVTCLNLVRFRLDRCHKKILWTHREVHLAPHPVVRLVLGFKSLALFFLRVSKHGPCFTAIEDLLVNWCFEPNQSQRITSGLNTNFNLSPSFSFNKSL